jgi:predicted amidohydrolase YtcJ
VRPPLSFVPPLLLLAACQAPADLVVRDATVHTMDAASSVVTGFAARDGVLVYVGDSPGAYIGPDTTVLTLDGAAVLPGFHDAHTHLLWSGADLLMVDLYSATDVASFQDTVATWAADHPDEAWVQGGGWDTSTFYGRIDRTTLDAVVTDRPAYVYSSDAHIGLASTLALAAAGITAATPDPADGTIERDANGEPTGVLLEGAMSLVDSLLPPYAEGTVDQGLRDAQSQANRFGLVSVVDAYVDTWMLDGYARAAARGELTVRVFGEVEVPPGSEGAAAEILDWANTYDTDRLVVAGAKLYLDGIIESQTAAMLEPYADGTNFTPYYTDADLQRLACELDAAGLQLHAHAIGDAAVRQFLDAVDALDVCNGPRDRRPLAAHIEVIDPDDIVRFAELGVYADFQPLWAYPDTYIEDLTEPVIGAERSEWLYPIGAVVDAGGTFVGGSDWSVTTQNPMPAIEVAVTRQSPWSDEGRVLTPQHLVDVETAIRAYTSEGAKASFSEDISGTLEVGKRADFIVLSDDPFAVDPHALSDVKVQQTWLDGARVYARNGADAKEEPERPVATERRAHGRGK